MGLWGNPWGFESLRLGQELVELPKRIMLIRNGSNGSKHPLCHGGTVEGVGKGEDLSPDFRDEAEHSHYLGHAGACNPLPEGNFGLTCDLPGFQESFPLVGFSEEFDDSGGFRFPGRFWVTTAGWDST